MAEETSATNVAPVEQSSTGNDRAGRRRSRAIRLSILGAILAVMTGLAFAHQNGVNVKVVGVDALCPFGGIETLWAVLSGGALIQRIAASSVILLVTTLVLAVVFGRAFCGYLCPLGALQEFVGRLRRFVGLKRPLEMPASVDRFARLLKYLVLAFFTAATWVSAQLVIRPYDPWVAWTHLTSAELLAEFSIGLLILVASLVGSVVYDRFFCKYLCPMGAVLALMKPLSIFRVARNADTCTNCRACDTACPMNVAVSQVDEVRDIECISCNECVNSCPVEDTLALRNRNATGRTALRPTAMAATTIAITLGLIAATSAAGVFAWTMPTAAEALAPAADGGVDVNQIKGRMSFAEIAQATGIPPATFEQQYGVAPDEMTVPIKDLAPKYGFDVHTDVREFVAAQIAAAASSGGGAEPAPED